MQYTLADLTSMAAYLEPHFAPHGIHVAAGGSCLHKGGSDKDLDLFLYPHNKEPGERADVNQEQAKHILRGLGFMQRCVATDPEFDNGSSAIPNVWCARYGAASSGTRVDFIFLAR